MMDTVALRVENLSVSYALRRSWMGLGPAQTLKAVQDVSLELRQGEILGLVGESGCGKSSLGKAIIRLIEPSGGKIQVAGSDFLGLQGKALRRSRSQIQMVFQDPYASLDPRMTVFDILAEPLHANGITKGPEVTERIQKVLGLVSIPLAHAKRYPHEFSGGQRQRVAIARALILEPQVIIADEPVSSLDVSVQAQILNLLKDIQKELNLSMLFISHNLAVVKYLADRIAVMYLGKVVEIASRDALFSQPQHPYTRTLLSAVPIPDPKKEKARVRSHVKGEIPSPINPPAGCAFHTRCPLATADCSASAPELLARAGSNNKVACFAVHPVTKLQAQFNA
jgi:oligopeptide/dipeptide ABC transporter ATP-binding protein